MFTMSHVSVWNTKFTNIHSHVCVYVYMCIYTYLQSQTCTVQAESNLFTQRTLSLRMGLLSEV